MRWMDMRAWTRYVLPLAFLSSAVSAQDLSALRACAAETDPERRLACYDREVARLPVEAQPAEPSAASAASAAQRDPEDEFGRRGMLDRKSRDSKLERLSVKVTELSRKPRGEIIVTLENGQIWQQRDASVNLNVRVGDTVTIREGALGGYWLSNTARQSAQVTRLK
jgi:hypothetical protein